MCAELESGGPDGEVVGSSGRCAPITIVNDRGAPGHGDVLIRRIEESGCRIGRRRVLGREAQRAEVDGQRSRSLRSGLATGNIRAGDTQFTTIQNDRAGERRIIVAVEAQGSIPRFDEQSRAGHVPRKLQNPPPLLDTQADWRRTAKNGRAADGQVVGVGIGRAARATDDQGRALQGVGAHDRESGDRIRRHRGRGACVVLTNDARIGHILRDDHGVVPGLAGRVVRAQPKFRHLPSVIVLQPVTRQRNRGVPQGPGTISVNRSAVHLHIASDGVASIGQVKHTWAINGEVVGGDAAAYASENTICVVEDVAFHRDGAIAEIERCGVKVDPRTGANIVHDEATTVDIDLTSRESGGTPADLERPYVGRASQGGIAGGVIGDFSARGEARKETCSGSGVGEGR